MLNSITNKRRALALTLLLSIIVLVAACGGAAPTTAPSAVSGLDTNYENALNARSILLLGTVRLEQGAGPALTKEQAAKMLPLWQASKSLIGSGTASQAEIDAVTNQILAVLSTDQVNAINAMHLTQADNQAFNQTLGITAPSSTTGSSMPGQGQSLSAEERATRQAASGKTGGNTAGIDYLINLLTAKAGA